MEQIPCFYCGGFFDPSPRHKNQSACKKEKCQKAKKAAWQRHRIKTDPIYAANQKSSPTMGQCQSGLLETLPREKP